MYKNRFMLILGVISLLLVTMAVSRPFVNAPLAADQGANDFYQRHTNWRWTGIDEPAVIPVVGGSTSPDYYQRHPELSAPAAASIDTTDYFLRHVELRAPLQSTDLSDYFQRHGELSAPVLTESLETPGLACESPVDCR